MVEFESLNGERIMVNPAHVKAVETQANMVGVYRLVLEYFPVNTAKGFTVLSHAVSVKNETMEDIRRKLAGVPPLMRVVN